MKQLFNLVVMITFLKHILFLPLVFLAFLSSSCKKQEYDLFPLKVGCEFYFTYSKSRMYDYINGNETWKVISVSSLGNANIYRIERKLNAIRKLAGKTIVISDSLRFFEINEDKSSSLLSFSSMPVNIEISFKRFQPDPVFEIKHLQLASNDVGWSYLFKADSGLTKYTYYHPPNQIVNESLYLDSLKLYP